MYVLMYILSVMTVKSRVTLSKIFYHKKSECAIEFSQILCILSSFSPNAFLYTDSSPCFSFFSQILAPVLLFFYFTFSRRFHSAPSFSLFICTYPLQSFSVHYLTTFLGAIHVCALFYWICIL